MDKQESLTFSLTRCFGGKKEKQIRALRKNVKKKDLNEHQLG